MADESLRIPGAEEALIGIVSRCGQPDVAVYCRDRLVQHFEKSGMDAEEASEWISFNIEGAWMGEGTPGVMANPLRELEWRDGGNGMHLGCAGEAVTYRVYQYQQPQTTWGYVSGSIASWNKACESLEDGMAIAEAHYASVCRSIMRPCVEGESDG